MGLYLELKNAASEICHSLGGEKHAQGKVADEHKCQQ